ncbi:hypothetical protein D210916BOD24_11190 [Alteromonas sp. D210916BOD_24]|uniref:hypothetical protein n=1 Tax=Alteromonas sp. D210916BOD_24 TaxID=3157618 RepID=UPI00399D3F84
MSKSNKPVSLANQSKTMPDPVADEARQQVTLLCKNADNLLLQLMQEQKAKLNDMLQHLKSSPESPRATTSQSPSQNTNQPGTTSKNESYVPPEPTVPIDEITHLQNQNLVQLDTIISRINATMNSNLQLAHNVENRMYEEASNDKP